MTPNPVSIIGGGLPDIGSCSMDSGVRGSSDRESAATSVGGGNLSDSTTDGEWLTIFIFIFLICIFDDSINSVMSS